MVLGLVNGEDIQQNLCVQSTCLARAHPERNEHRDGNVGVPHLAEKKLFIFKVNSNAWNNKLLQQVQVNWTGYCSVKKERSN